ncbi:MAG: hypothetical protein IPO08_21715 [Xanthomonadales bacterium]|nr:hypothetical protein [Xanthomonadales bacterium]
MSTERQVFTPAALQTQIDTALAQVPPGANGALLGYARTDGSAGVAIALKAGQHWALRGVLTREAEQGRVTGGVSVQLTW